MGLACHYGDVPNGPDHDRLGLKYEWMAMLRLNRDNPRARATRLVAGLAMAVGLAALAGALVFEYGLGLTPCPLCMDQRYAHGAAIIGGLIAMLVAGHSIGLALAALALADLAYMIGAGIAFFHAGVEYHFWPGPQTCTGAPIANSLDALKAALENAPLAFCDSVPWSIFGVSMAGINFILSAGTAGVMAVLMVGIIQWTRPGRRRPWRSF